MALKEADNADMAQSAVEMLAENYKKMFALDNARNILLDLAKKYPAFLWSITYIKVSIN